MFCTGVALSANILRAICAVPLVFQPGLPPELPPLPAGNHWVELNPQSTDPEVRRLIATSARASQYVWAQRNIATDEARQFFESVIANPIDPADVVNGYRELARSFRKTNYSLARAKLDLARQALVADPALDLANPRLGEVLLMDIAQIEQFFGGTPAGALAAIEEQLSLPSSRSDPSLRWIPYVNASSITAQQNDLVSASSYIDRLFNDALAVGEMTAAQAIQLRLTQAAWYDDMSTVLGDRAQAQNRRIDAWTRYGAGDSVSVSALAISIAAGYSVGDCHNRKLWSFRAYTKLAAIRHELADHLIVMSQFELERLYDSERALLTLFADGVDCDATVSSWAAQQLQQPRGTRIGELPSSGIVNPFGPPPYLLNRTSSGISPSADPAESDRPLLNSELCSRVFHSCDNCLPERPNPTPFHFQSRTISLVFDGPIKAEAPGTTPVHVFIEDATGQITTVNDYANSMAFEIVDNPHGIEKSVLVLRGLSQVTLIPGVYHVRPKVTGSERLLCDQLPLGWGVTPVYWTQASDDFVFTLHGDCNLNGVDDELDLAANAGDDIYEPFGLPDCCSVPLCDPDLNQDGNADQGDIEYLVAVIAGQPNPTGINPDYNRDGSVDQADIDALINSVAGNGCPYASCGF